MSETTHDVIIVGAGPVGLAVALGLARSGHSVLVLEKEADLSERSRAPIIWPRTLEILSDLGVAARCREEGIVRSEIELWDADRDRRLLHVPIGELKGDTEFPEILVLPQADTERLLLDALREHERADVRFSAEATSVDSHGDGVTVHYEQEGASRSVTGRFAAGCDGAHSMVRDALDASFEGRTYRMRAALVDVETHEADYLTSPRMARKRGVATAIRIEPGVWRIIVPRGSDAETPLDDRIHQAVTDLLGTEAYEPTWKSEFDLHRRISSRFVRGRVALAGDAAHLTSPVGGQGMNIGLQDARALVDALDVALEANSTEPLEPYAEIRRKALQGGAVEVTDALTGWLLAWRGALLVPTLRMISFVLGVPAIRRFVMRRMALLDDPSRGS